MERVCDSPGCEVLLFFRCREVVVPGRLADVGQQSVEVRIPAQRDTHTEREREKERESERGEREQE